MSEQDDRKFDLRTIERRLNEGEVTQEEYEDYLEDLPDVSDNAVELEAEFEEDVLEDDEDEPEAEAGDEEEVGDEAEAEEREQDDEDEDEE